MSIEKTKIYSKITVSGTQTKKIGMQLCREIINKLCNKAIQKYIIILEGQIGSGKTVLTKGIAKELRIKSEINSPSFVLLKTYTNNFNKLHHLDLYRLFDEHKETKYLITIIEELLENIELGDIIVMETNRNIMSFFEDWDCYIKIDVLNSKKRNILIEQKNNF